MTALTSPCLVVYDMKCLRGLAAKHVVPTLWQLAARCTGFLVVPHHTEVKLCYKSDVTNLIWCNHRDQVWDPLFV